MSDEAERHPTTARPCRSGAPPSRPRPSPAGAGLRPMPRSPRRARRWRPPRQRPRPRRPPRRRPVSPSCRLPRPRRPPGWLRRRRWPMRPTRNPNQRWPTWPRPRRTSDIGTRSSEPRTCERIADLVRVRPARAPRADMEGNADADERDRPVRDRPARARPAGTCPRRVRRRRRSARRAASAGTRHGWSRTPRIRPPRAPRRRRPTGLDDRRGRLPRATGSPHSSARKTAECSARTTNSAVGRAG